MTMSTSGCDYDVVVIGGGLSGLSAADKLKKIDPDCEVLVLEAKERVGGRTLTVELQGARGKDKWDLGGQWVGRGQPHILNLLEELGIETYKQYTDGIKFMQIGDSKIRNYRSNIPSLSLFALIDLQLFINRVEKMMKQVPLENPAKAEKALEWDSMTVETFKRKHLSTKDAMEAVNAAVRIIFGMECTEMSLLYFLHYGRASGGMNNMIEASEGASQEFKIKGGAQQVSEKLADRIGRDSVWLGEPVTHINQEDPNQVTVITESGKTVSAKRVIMSAPPHLAGKIDFKPPLPLEKQSLIQRQPVGHLLKFLATYSNTFWRENGQSGEVVCSYGDPVLIKDSGPLCLVYDATSGYGNPALVGFLNKSRQWSKVSPEERKQAVLDHLSQFFGEMAGKPIEYADKDWGQEPYNGGCPVNVMMPGAITYFHEALRKPFDRLHWAGTETATHSAGFMSGAIQAGLRAADEVVANLKPELEAVEDDVDPAHVSGKLSI
ncbi:probable flavin-containing monoamine oxidase A isoform X2 [Ptychodera flava]|uniref:probable flavin-containing monoamine oxidase A isoform X2 n=1 Tax=Ptychodera flava TaxID=63121 RepID=UPI00396A8668